MVHPGSTLSLAPIAIGFVLLLGCDDTSSGPDPDQESDAVESIWVIPGVGFRAGPLRADANRVYVSTPSGVAALDQETGELIWETLDTVGRVGLPYVISGGVVAVVRGDALVGLRATNGEVLYNHEGTPTGALIASEPDGLFATDGEIVVSYDPLTGTPRWSAPLERGGTTIRLSAGSQLVCAGRLFSPPGQFRVTCYARSDGSFRWSRLVTGLPIAITATRVVVSGLELREGSGWMGLDPATGEPVWKNPGLSGHGPAISVEDVLYACATECIAVRVIDGGVMWRTSLDGEVGPPGVGEESVFVVGSLRDRNPLYVLDARSGAVRARIVPDDPSEPSGFCGTPAAGGGLLFVFGCREGNLYAYRMR